MSKIYISYWAKVRKFPPTLVGLNTTVWPPKWRPLGKDKRGVFVIDCPPLVPGAQCAGLCDGTCNPKVPENCQFLYQYKQQLDNIDMPTFLNKLKQLEEKICKGEGLDHIDFALIVWETLQAECSERWPLGRWLRENDIEVEEWGE